MYQDSEDIKNRKFVEAVGHVLNAFDLTIREKKLSFEQMEEEFENRIKLLRVYPVYGEIFLEENKTKI